MPVHPVPTGGTKKVQQALAAPGVLEKFMGGGASTGRVRDIFTGLYSLDFDDGGERAVEMALADAERFVLKPQREGGGNNLYGADVREALLRMRHSRERAAYILMERILPPLISWLLTGWSMSACCQMRNSIR
ncbi:hypothetical protein MSG28_009439 [Choristoneura fumiferana]|uniref:Uncharacterized protein n=1 Tax=Choristoneura fumiferana TaxID=7141 RepID=A0ACC0JB54_CHOFU|nr:hypothetical protein MSG28_009439 [Choristoneura fumiferana]